MERFASLCTGRLIHSRRTFPRNSLSLFNVYALLILMLQIFRELGKNRESPPTHFPWTQDSFWSSGRNCYFPIPCMGSVVVLGVSSFLFSTLTESPYIHDHFVIFALPCRPTVSESNFSSSRSAISGSIPLLHCHLHC